MSTVQPLNVAKGRLGESSRHHLLCVSALLAFSAAICAVFLASGCYACNSTSAGLPKFLIVAGAVVSTLSGMAYLLAWFRPRQDFARVGLLLNLAVFAGLLIAAMYAVATKSSYYVLCINFWSLTGLSAFLQTNQLRFSAHFLNMVLLGAVLFHLFIPGAGEGPADSKGLARTILSALAIDLEPQLGREMIGRRFEHPRLKSHTGLVVLLTQCSDCAARAVDTALTSLKEPMQTVVVTPDQSDDWTIPLSLAQAERITSFNDWTAAKPVKSGKPIILRLVGGKVLEVMR